MNTHWLDKWELEQEMKQDENEFFNLLLESLPMFTQAIPIGPFKVLEYDDSDNTYLLHDTGMYQKYDGLPSTVVWVYCDSKLIVNRVYGG